MWTSARAACPLWAVPARGALVLAASPRPGAACLAGPQRLAELGPLLRFARGLRVYSPAVDAQSLPVPSAWELDLGTARFTLTLSPGHYRGFSGEGALLGSFADDDVTVDAELMGVLLAWSPRIDIRRLSTAAGLSPERSVLALIRLAASGRVGYDLAEQSFFHRELPFGQALEKLHPRLVDARALIASGAVTGTALLFPRFGGVCGSAGQRVALRFGDWCGGEALAVASGGGLSPAAGGDDAERKRDESAASDDGPGGVA
jgi:hypothetical protein